jgi:hypothetical protein
MEEQVNELNEKRPLNTLLFMDDQIFMHKLEEDVQKCLFKLWNPCQ